MSRTYVVDTNFFIQAHRMNYPLDVVVSFWEQVKDLAEKGLIVSLDKVKKEIYQGQDELKAWCDEYLPEDFFKDSSRHIYWNPPLVFQIKFCPTMIARNLSFSFTFW